MIPANLDLLHVNMTETTRMCMCMRLRNSRIAGKKPGGMQYD